MFICHNSSMSDYGGYWLTFNLRVQGAGCLLNGTLIDCWRLLRSPWSWVMVISYCRLFAFSIACFNASTRDVCPTPLPISCLFFARTMVFDFVCFASLLANKRSSTSLAVATLLVAFLKSSGLAFFASMSCSNIPFNTGKVDEAWLWLTHW